MTIKANTWPLEDTRTAENNCHWHIECEVDGKKFATRSRRGAPEKLSRELKAAGIPDQRLEVYILGKLSTSYRSFYGAAQYTYGESARMALRRGKFIDVSERIGADA